MQEENNNGSTIDAVTPVIEEVKPVYATIDDFMKIEIKVGTVLSASIVEGADKLYILQVDLNEVKPRQIHKRLL